MYRFTIHLVLLTLCCSPSGCASPDRTASLNTDVAAHYREHGDHASLYWIAQNVLKDGMPEGRVVQLLGPGIDPPVNDRGATRVYPSHRDEPLGHLLLVHYSPDRRVLNWEWASE
jgi:hypothetical protein